MRGLVLFVLSIVLVPIPVLARNDAARYDPALLSLTFGAFCQQASVDSVPAPDTLAERVDLIDGSPEIRWPGPVIPAIAGLSFGIRTETADDVGFSPVIIDVTHPPFVGSGLTHQSYVSSLNGTSINAYSFDLPEEMVTGEWIIRAIYEGEILYEVRFQVVPPHLAPGIGRDCGAQFVS